MPNKIRLRDLDPELRSMIAGGEVTDGELNNILSKYRKKTDVIAEQDIDIKYRDKVYNNINYIKTKLEEHLNKILVVAESDLTPELQQRLNDIERRLNEAQGGEDFGADIQRLQFNFDSLKSVVDNLDLTKYDKQFGDMSDKINAIQDKIDAIKSHNDSVDKSLTDLGNELTGKRDKDTPIAKADLASDVVADIEKVAEALKKVSDLSVLVESKRDKNDPIEKGDLSAIIISEIQEGVSALAKVVELSNHLDAKRDKADLITEGDLSADLIDCIQKGASALSHVNSILDSLNTKRDKNVSITKDDLSEDVVAELGRISDLLSQITDINNAIDTKRSKDDLIEEADLAEDIIDELRKISSLKDEIDNIPTQINGRFDGKRDKDVLIEEYDLSSEIKNKLTDGTNALQLATDTSSKMNLFPEINPGDFLGVLSSKGNIGGKSAFKLIVTVDKETDIERYRNNQKIPAVLVLENGEYYEWRQKETESGDADDKELVKVSNYLKEQPSLWNTFIIDRDSYKIVAFITSAGDLVLLRPKKTLSLNAGASQKYTRDAALNTPVEVLGKTTDGKYVSADAYITVLYEENSYTIVNESDEKLDLIIIEE